MVRMILVRCFADIYVQQGVVSPQHFHYVAPSFWAWKGGETRLRGLSEFVDHLLCILPFEAEVCKANGIAATFVGHPTLEDIIEVKDKNISGIAREIQGNGEKFKADYGISSGSTIISLLPGSRSQEVTRMLPLFRRTIKQLSDSVQELINVIHVAPNSHVVDYINHSISEWPVPVLLIPGGSLCTKYDSFSASEVALCTSGTVAMELQLARLPCVVAYRAHFLTEWIIRYKAKVPYISLTNILLDSPIIPEALLQECTPSKMASLLIELIHNEDLRKQQISAAGKVIELLTPQKGMISNSMLRDMGLPDPDSPPSMIAASTILYSRRL